MDVWERMSDALVKHKHCKQAALNKAIVMEAEVSQASDGKPDINSRKIRSRIKREKRLCTGGEWGECHDGEGI